jgi:hypothetical protein
MLQPRGSSGARSLVALLVAVLVGSGCRCTGGGAAAVTPAPLKRFLIMARLSALTDIPAARDKHRNSGTTL